MRIFSNLSESIGSSFQFSQLETWIFDVYDLFLCKWNLLAIVRELTVSDQLASLGCCWDICTVIWLLGYVSVVSLFILVLDCRLFSFFLKSINIQFVELVFQESQSHIKWYVYVSLIKLGKKKVVALVKAMEFNPVLDWIILSKADAQVGFDFKYQALWCCVFWARLLLTINTLLVWDFWVIGSHDPFKQQIDRYDKISFC